MWNEAVYRPTVLEINVTAVEHNINAFQRHLPSSVEIMAIVKANGYGHGAVPIAQRALAAGATRLGVAVLDEAIELREAGITAPILILGYVPVEALTIAQRYNVAITMYCEEQVEQVIDALENIGVSSSRLAIHLKVDTGMNRIGFSSMEVFRRACQRIAQASGIFVEGIFTHLAKADDEDETAARDQHERFQSFLHVLREQRMPVKVIHVDNSAGAIRFPQWGYNSIRLGISLYGLYPSAYSKKISNIKLSPVLTLKSSIVHIKEVPPGTPISYGGTFVTTTTSVIATIPIGYGDGYPRVLSNQAHVLVHGQRAPIVGRICMDQLMIDVTSIPHAGVGDEVVLIGRQGEDEISVDELADLSYTINYEIVTRLSSRILRKYVHQV